MTITKFSLIVAVIAVVLTFLMKKHIRSLLMSYLQNFLGVFFVISGAVKVVDPLGTAYKMGDYFDQFYFTFEESSMNGLAPIFPALAAYATPIAVAMIVFEMMLGVSLIVGWRPKFTAWAFFSLMLVFTILTGFTYLNGYVPDGVNFFEFSKWGAFADSQMKVTDCGCFGDFMKLKPFTTFTKDVIMLFPALFFIFGRKRWHQLFKSSTRNGLVWLSTLAFLGFGLYNFVLDIPVVDFRPFKVGVNIRDQAALEADAEAAVEVLAFKMTHKSTGEILEVPYKQYMKEYKNYPKEEWSSEQIKTEPIIPSTKLSEFSVQDLAGNEVTEDIWNEKGYSFMFVSYQIEKEVTKNLVTVMDTSYVSDTIVVNADSVRYESRISGIKELEKEVLSISFPESFLEPFREKITPLAKAAKKAGAKPYLIIGLEDPEVAENLLKEIGGDFPVFMADKILLKTIVRSNPGTVLLKDGLILGKWHHNKLPAFGEVQKRYMLDSLTKEN